MRLRYVKDAKEKILRNPHLIYNDMSHEKINLTKWKKTTKQIHLEIGTGKGRFLHEMSKNHHDILFLGMEKFDSAIVKALDKLLVDLRENMRLIRADAIYLTDLFEPNSIIRIYLNFSDPWPKARHEKRRLTHPTFLARYKEILAPGGEIHFKTDNRDLFDYSIQTMKDAKMILSEVTYDLHKEYQGHIMTEFEQRFTSLGQPICRLVAQFKEDFHG
jgi:tRNA (guanine-N7-)-methyltransferase